nr:MAG TPA: hypothetical protein [Caudoviricetes sp.]
MDFSLFTFLFSLSYWIFHSSFFSFHLNSCPHGGRGIL